MPESDALYDRVGAGYRATRIPDPRIARQIAVALGDSRSVANVGAGAGSYEPPTTVAAVEPSVVMIEQRPPDAVQALCARAEAIPLADDSVDAAMAILTVHHWTDLAAGIAELKRIARRRIVVLTWDYLVTRDFWLMRDYLPELAVVDAELATPLDDLAGQLGATDVQVVPVPHDCTDGFAAAFWRRPESYLHPSVRAGMSMFVRADAAAVRGGLAVLADDLATGRWRARYAELCQLDEADLGYRLLIADLQPP